MTSPIRIFAWGNVGRRDDGAALVLLERLRRADLGPEVALHEYHQLGPEVVDLLADCRLALFIDAHVREDAGDVLCEPVQPTTTGAMDTHHCTPDQLLALAAALGYSTPPSRLIGIRAHDLAFGHQLSPATEAAVAQAERLVRRHISTGPDAEQAAPAD